MNYTHIIIDNYTPQKENINIDKKCESNSNFVFILIKYIYIYSGFNKMQFFFEIFI